MDDASDVRRSDSGDIINLEMDMAERPGMVDRLGQQLDGATGSKLKRTVSGNVDDLVESLKVHAACAARACKARKRCAEGVERVSVPHLFLKVDNVELMATHTHTCRHDETYLTFFLLRVKSTHAIDGEDSVPGDTITKTTIIEGRFFSIASG